MGWVDSLIANSLDRWIARPLDRTTAQLLDRSIVRRPDGWAAEVLRRSITWSLDCTTAPLFDRLVARSINHSIGFSRDCWASQTLDCSISCSRDCPSARLLLDRWCKMGDTRICKMLSRIWNRCWWIGRSIQTRRDCSWEVSVALAPIWLESMEVWKLSRVQLVVVARSLVLFSNHLR